MMLETHPEVRERLDRARTEAMVADVVATEPTVVQITNEDSGRVHSVTVDALHCSCEDHTYRGTFCKHLLYLLDEAEGDLGEQVRQELIAHRQEVTTEANEARETLEALNEKLDRIAEVFQATDTDPVADDTYEKTAQIVAADQDGPDVESESEPEPEQVPGTEMRSDDGLSRMVADLTADDGEGN